MTTGAKSKPETAPPSPTPLLPLSFREWLTGQTSGGQRRPRAISLQGALNTSFLQLCGHRRPSTSPPHKDVSEEVPAEAFYEGLRKRASEEDAGTSHAHVHIYEHGQPLPLEMAIHYSHTKPGVEREAFPCENCQLKPLEKPVVGAENHT